MNKYKSIVQYELTIEANNKDTAEYLTQQSIPKHINNTTSGRDGSGNAKFVSAEIISVCLETVKI